MNYHQRKEQGAVLVISLIVMLLVSILVFSSMQGGVLQERMTGNQHHQIIASMAAETGAVEIYEWSMDPNNSVENWSDVFSGLKLASDIGNIPSYYSIELLNDPNDDLLQFVITGISGDDAEHPFAISRLEIMIALGDRIEIDNEGVFSSAVIGCERVNLSGSGLINSYHSLNNGPYSEGTANSNANVFTTHPSGVVQLTGSSPIHGNIFAHGGVNTTGSASIHGPINSAGDITLSGGGSVVNGNVSTEGNINFTSSAVINGNATANGDISFENWSARVDGNARAGGDIIPSSSHRSPSDHVSGIPLPENDPGYQFNNPVDCDPLNISDINSSLQTLASSGTLNVGNWPSNNWVITPDEVRYFDETWNVKDWVVSDQYDLNPASNAIVDGDVFVVEAINLGSNGNLHIEGGDVVIYVKGDINIGGNSSITIAEDSSLTFITDGRFSVGGSGRIVPDSGHSSYTVNTEGKPYFSMYSGFSESACLSNNCNNAGVNLTGNTSLPGVIYAPLANINTTGSGALFGSAIGLTVNVSGAGGVHYDEALKDVGPVSGGGNTGGETESQSSLVFWRMVSG